MPGIFKCAKCGAFYNSESLPPGDHFVCPACGESTVIPVGDLSGAGISPPPSDQMEPAESPLGPRNVSEIVVEIFRIVRQVPALFGAAAIVGVVWAVPFVYFWFPDFDRFPMPVDPPPVQLPAPDIGSFLATFFLGGILVLLGVTLLNGFLYSVVGDVLLGRERSLGRSFHISLRRLLPGVGAQLLSFFAMAVLFVTIIGIPVAYYMILAWQFSIGFTTLCQSGPIEGMKRSYRLVSGNWWRVFGILLVLGVCAEAVLIPLMLLSMLATKAAFGLLLPVGIVLSLMMSIGQVLLYFDLRVRKEGLTVEQLSSELDALRPAQN